MERLKEHYHKQFQIFEDQKKQIRRLWNISEKTAELLYMLVSLKQPRNILEIGSSNGYSTFWLSLAAEKFNSNIISLEVDRKRYEMATQNLCERDNIKLLHGKAEEIIPDLLHKIDFVFIDAGKINYIDYLKILVPKLNDNALLIADNVTSHKDTVEDYLTFLRSEEHFETMTLPLDDGVEITIFKNGENNV